MKLDEKLYHLRKEKGFTQAYVADKLHISRQAVSRWEIGAAVPSLENIKVMSELFDVPVEYLLPDKGNSEEAPSGETAEEKVVQKGEGPAVMQNDNQLGISSDSELADDGHGSLETESTQMTENHKAGSSARHVGRTKKLVCIVVIALLVLAALGIGLSRMTANNKDEMWLSEMETDDVDPTSETGFHFDFE